MNRANIIAKTEFLTEEILLREVFDKCRNICSIRKKKKKILQDLKEVASLFGKEFYLDKQFIIYAFIRLWYENKVEDYEFKRAFYKYIYIVVGRYGDWYGENKIREIQEALIVV